MRSRDEEQHVITEAHHASVLEIWLSLLCDLFVRISVLNILNHTERKKGNRDKVDEKEKNNGVHSFEMLSVRLILICLDAEYSRYSHTVLSTELLVRTCDLLSECTYFLFIIYTNIFLHIDHCLKYI